MAPNNNQLYDNVRMNKNMQAFLNNQRQNRNQNNNQNGRRHFRVGTIRGHSTTFALGRENFLDRAVDLLDPELRPIPPQPNCPQSMQIYEDHRLLAADYLDVQKELEDLTRYKAELQSRLNQPIEAIESQPKQEEVEKFVRLQSEKEALLQFQEKLSTQLQLIKKAKNKQLSQQSQQQQQNFLHQPPMSFQHHHQHNQLLSHAVVDQNHLQLTQATPTSRSLEDGWVLVQENR